MLFVEQLYFPRKVFFFHKVYFLKFFEFIQVCFGDRVHSNNGDMLFLTGSNVSIFLEMQKYLVLDLGRLFDV